MVPPKPITEIRQIDEESLRAFAQKGQQDSRHLPQTGEGNAVKVRRIVQVVQDLSNRPMSDLQVLDLACGEGVYSIEIGLHGAQVLGVDAPLERMQVGIDCASKNGLGNVDFKQADIRELRAETHGRFDVILFLGILYHLDVPDSFLMLKCLYEMCEHILIVDTHISLGGPDAVTFENCTYQGKKGREHEDEDNEQQRQAKLLMSIDNVFNFIFTRESLVRLLTHVGFTSVYECESPLEANKPRNRVTLVAIKGEPVPISSYPWINHLSEDEISQRIAPRKSYPGFKVRAQQAANKFLRPFGVELRKIN